ncbi:MAG TPA: transglutaminase domain-containing protein [Candidatus Limnocylindrales bacterium]|nr:transglutaminase domain-containing protein [Candidatus Limnocylindrales bacterium]
MTVGGVRIGRPAEGWLTLALVTGLAVIVAWAVDDPRWVNGKGQLTDVLAVCAVGGVAVGFLGPKVGWGRWTSHLMGAVMAGLLLPILAGWTLVPGASPGAAFVFTASGTIDAYLDIAWRNYRFTDQEIHYVLVLGGLIWGTGQFASYAVFGHRRPLNAVVVMGLVLVVNMALTSRDQDELAYLVAFTAGSLFLLIGMHAFDERSTWIRRRIGDPATISSMYLRGGTVFIVLALVGSMALTQRAASSPLEGAWEGVGRNLVSFGESISRLLPMGGALRPIGGVQFGQDARISDTWITDAGVAFSATVPAAAEGLKWRAATYDSFELNAWGQSFLSTIHVDGGQPILAGTADEPKEAMSLPVTVTVRPAAYEQGLLLAPGGPVTVDQGTNVSVTGNDGWFAAADLERGSDAYTVESRVLKLDETQQLLTGHRLEAAGTSYPAEIRALYTEVPDGAIGPDAQELLDKILARADTTNPYRLAAWMQDYFQNTKDFTYDNDLTNDPSCSASAVECFARIKRGYCLHYASTMAILLRAANPVNPIPTRLVQGFLPAKAVNGVETVENRNAHAWVEVYFPGYGWIPFDPTGGGVGQPTVIAEGPALPSALPSPSGSAGPDLPDPTRRRDGTLPDAPSAGVTGGGAGDRSLFIVLTVLLAIVVVTIAFAAWLRGPRGDVSPDAAWMSMSRAASRFGFGPRPTQTVYEYASSLGDLVPVAKADLQTVAQAKVETTYAGVRLGGARLDAVRDATRRLRISLLRLLFRRPRKGRPR